MTLASDMSTAIATANTAIGTIATQLELLESYRRAQGDGGKAFYDANGRAVSLLRDQLRSQVEPLLNSLIRGA